MSSLIESWLLDNNFWKTDQVSWCAPIKMTQKPWNPGARIIITTNLFTSQLAYFSAGSVLFQSLLILEKYPFCPHAYVILLYLSHHWVTTSLPMSANGKTFDYYFFLNTSHWLFSSICFLLSKSSRKNQ